MSSCRSQHKHGPSGSCARAPPPLEHGRCAAHAAPVKQKRFNFGDPTQIVCLCKLCSLKVCASWRKAAWKIADHPPGTVWLSQSKTTAAELICAGQQQQGSMGTGPGGLRTALHRGASSRLLLKVHTPGQASGELWLPLAQKAPALVEVTKSVADQPLRQPPALRPSSSSLHDRVACNFAWKLPSNKTAQCLR